MTVTNSELVLRDSEPTSELDLWEPDSVFVADWSVPVEFTNSYTTVIHESRTGKEARVGIANKPRKTLLSQNKIFDAQDVTDMKGNMRRAGEARTLAPVLCDGCELLGVRNPQAPYGPSWNISNAVDSRISKSGWSMLGKKQNHTQFEKYAFCGDFTINTSGYAQFCNEDRACCFDEMLGEITYGNPSASHSGKSAMANIPSGGFTMTATMDMTTSVPTDGDHVIVVVNYMLKRGEQVNLNNFKFIDSNGRSVIAPEGFEAQTIGSDTKYERQSEIDTTRNLGVKIFKTKINADFHTAGAGAYWNVIFDPSYSGGGASWITMDVIVIPAVEVDETQPFPPNAFDDVEFWSRRSASAFGSSYTARVPGETIFEVVTAHASSADSNWDATGTSWNTYGLPPSFSVTGFSTQTGNTTGGSSINFEFAKDSLLARYTGTYNAEAIFTARLTEGGSDPTSQTREGILSRIRINPSTQTAAHYLYPAMETDMSFQVGTDLVTREISVMMSENNETIGKEAIDPLVDIAELPTNYQTIKFTDPEDNDFECPVLERSPDFESATYEVRRSGDESQIGIGRQMHSYGDHRTTFDMSYTFLNRSDAFDFIRLFQSRGGRLHPFFQVPTTTEFSVVSVGSSGLRTATINIGDAQDDALNDMIGRYLSVFNGSEYQLRKILGWSRETLDENNIRLDIDEDFGSDFTTVSNLSRAGIAHLCRFGQDSLTESWVTSKIMKCQVTTIEIVAEQYVSMQKPTHTPSGTSCAQMFCGNTGAAGACPRCPNAGEEDTCTCACPQGATMACGYDGGPQKCGPNPYFANCYEGNIFGGGEGSGVDGFCKICSPIVNITVRHVKFCCSNSPCDSSPDDPSISCNYVNHQCTFRFQANFLLCASHAYEIGADGSLGGTPSSCYDGIREALAAATDGWTPSLEDSPLFWVGIVGPFKIGVGVKTGYVCDHVKLRPYHNSSGHPLCDEEDDGFYPKRVHDSNRWLISDDFGTGQFPDFRDYLWGPAGCGGYAGTCGCDGDPDEAEGGWTANCQCGITPQILGADCTQGYEQDNCYGYNRKAWYATGTTGCCVQSCGPNSTCLEIVEPITFFEITVPGAGGQMPLIDPILGDTYCDGQVWTPTRKGGGCPDGCRDFDSTNWCQ